MGELSRGRFVRLHVSGWMRSAWSSSVRTEHSGPPLELIILKKSGSATRKFQKHALAAIPPTSVWLRTFLSLKPAETIRTEPYKPDVKPSRPRLDRSPFSSVEGGADGGVGGRGNGQRRD